MKSLPPFRPLLPLLIVLSGTLRAAAQSAPAPADFPEDQKRPNWVRPYLQAGTEGEEPGKLFLPKSLAFGKDDRILVADTANNRIQEFSIGGKAAGTWGRAGSGPGEFLSPAAIAVGDGEEVFVADTGNDRIQVLDANGAFLREWGRPGVAPGELKAPVAVAVAKGRVAVVEAGACRVQVFTSSGEPLLSFGRHGGAPGEFREPAGISIDGQGDLYVSDSGNHRIQKFSPKGEPLLQWGSWGTYRGFLSSPAGIVASGNRIYVADSGNHRIQVFDRSGAFLYQWGRPPVKQGQGEGRLHFPAGLAVSASGGFTAVCEPLESRVQVFANGSARQVTPSNDLPWWDNLHAKSHTRAGAVFLAPENKLWKRPPSILAALVEPEAHSVLFFDVGVAPGLLVARAGGPGHRLGEFCWPSSVVRQPETGRFYVCDRGNRRIQILELAEDPKNATRFASWVRFIGAFEPGAMVPSSVAGFRPEWSSPEAVGFDSKGNIYVADAFNAMVLVFDSDVRFSRAIRLPDSRKGKPARLRGVAVHPDGTIYVLEALRGEILGIGPSGDLASSWNGATGTPMPGAITLDATGAVVVTDLRDRNIKRLNGKGYPLLKWGIAGRQEGFLLSPEGIAFLQPDLVLVDDFGNHCGNVSSGQGRFVQLLMKGGDVPAPAVPK